VARSVPFLVALALLLPVGTGAAPPDPAAVEAEVDAYLQPLLDLDLISGSVLIARGGEVLLAKGYGPADREYGIPNTPDTKFRLGSVTKQFTAAAIMLLQERGQLSVDDPLARFLPDFPRADEIRLHHLLTHSSGVTNYNELPDYHTKLIQPLSIAEVIDWFKDVPPQFAPGERFSYSNSGYVLLAAVIEKVSGRTYADFLRESLFAPLGMDGTGQDDYTTVLPGRAEGYVNDGREIYRALYRDLPFTSGAGSLYSTVRDLYRWDRALRTDTPLSAAARERMFSAQQGEYGYGWFIRERCGRRLITHGGGINGFLTDFQRFVDDDVTVIVLLNYESTFAWRVFDGLGAIALGEPYEPALLPAGAAVPPERLAAAVGVYRIDEQNDLTVAQADGGLTVQVTGEEPCAAVPQSDAVLFLRDRNALLQLKRDDDGKVTTVTLRQGAAGFRAERLP